MKVTIATRLYATTPGYAETRTRLLNSVAFHRDATGTASTTVPTVTGRTPVTITARGEPDAIADFVKRMGADLARAQID